MSIHRRLAEVHQELKNMKIEKTGHNKHKGFKYYELDDIIGPITDQCYKHEISLEFSFVEETAILKLVDWNNPKEYLVFRIGLPEIVTPEKNPNNQIIQTIGANISYLQRYLLKLAFPVLSDKDVIDSTSIDDASSATTKENNNSSDKSENTKKDEVADLPMGELVLEAKEKLVKKGVSEKDITYKALKQTMMHMRKWTVPERRAIINYFKEKEGSK